MTTYTPEVQNKLKEYLATHDLPKGLGTEEIVVCSLMKVQDDPIADALEKCQDVSVDDVVYMVYKRQEELEQGPEE